MGGLAGEAATGVGEFGEQATSLVAPDHHIPRRSVHGYAATTSTLGGVVALTDRQLRHPKDALNPKP